jgi:hypothetical protein
MARTLSDEQVAARYHQDRLLCPVPARSPAEARVAHAEACAGFFGSHGSVRTETVQRSRVRCYGRSSAGRR